jgi:hypothetical protein
MRNYLAFLVFCLMASNALAQSSGVDITGYGIMSGSAGVRDGVSSNGIEHRHGSATIVQTTTTIPACIGVRFGIGFSIAGAAGSAPVSITEVYKFPRSGLHKPDAPFPIPETRFETALVPGVDGDGFWYEFDYPWELVPGDWIFEVRRNDRVLASKTFTVVAATQAQCPYLGA